MRIAVGQLASGNDVAANLSAIGAAARGAAADGAELLVLPEYSTYEQKVVDASFPAVAEGLDGPVVRELAGIAAHNGIGLVAGVVEHSSDPGRAHNTLVALDSSGALLAAYRKVHLFDAQGFAESAFIAPSPDLDPVLFSLGGVRFGMLTCYDLRFPEQARAVSDAGAQVLLACASWVPGEHKRRQWQTLTAARAIENGFFVAGACQAAPVSVGHSAVLDPMGAVLGELGADPGLLVVDIAPESVASVRARFPVAGQRRIGSPGPQQPPSRGCRPVADPGQPA